MRDQCGTDQTEEETCPTVHRTSLYGPHAATRSNFYTTDQSGIDLP